jgi:hypothetical protein
VENVDELRKYTKHLRIASLLVDIPTLYPGYKTTSKPVNNAFVAFKSNNNKANL